MAQVEKLLIFLASPSDVARERGHVKEVIEHLNHSFAAQQGIVLEVVTWEHDTYPGYGSDAQTIVNEQIAEMARYSLFVGIMWNRVGTPTPRAPSGTVEEFERATAAQAKHGHPDIWFYFRDAPARPNDEQKKQRKQVLKFQKQVRAKGLPWSYTGPSDFRNKFDHQMSLWLSSRNRETKTTPVENTNDRAAEAASAVQALKTSDTWPGVDNFPPKAYQQLIGREDEISKILGALKEPERKPAIAVVGLGGIGKTALAREALERSRDKGLFQRFVWTSARTEQFVGERISQIESAESSFDDVLREIYRQCGPPEPPPASNQKAVDIAQISPADREAAVKDLLRNKRVLIVLDNLETIPNGEALVDKLLAIIGNSKVLITSRHQLKLEVYHIVLGGLSKEAGVRFLQAEARERGIETLARANRSTLTEIHRVTGGQPLAMKLVVGQASRQPIKIVLTALQEASASGQNVDLYRFIYRRSWADLDQHARELLVDMSVFPPVKGGRVEDVESISQVEGPAFWPAMDQLVRFSLVDKIGPAGDERYALHHLTQYFVRSDITKEWAE